MSPDAIRVQEIADRAYETASDSMGCIEVLEAGNTAAVRDACEGKSAFAFQLIQNSVFSRLHMQTVREFGRVLPGDGHLAVAFALLAESSVWEEVAAAGDERHLQQARDLWTAAKQDARLLRLQHLRNKQLAHLSEMDPAIGVPIIKELFDVARLTAAICEQLAFGAGQANVPLEDQTAAHRECATAFWKLVR